MLRQHLGPGSVSRVELFLDGTDNKRLTAHSRRWPASSVLTLVARWRQFKMQTRREPAQGCRRGCLTPSGSKFPSRKAGLEYCIPTGEASSARGRARLRAGVSGGRLLRGNSGHREKSSRLSHSMVALRISFMSCRRGRHPPVTAQPRGRRHLVRWPPRGHYPRCTCEYREKSWPSLPDLRYERHLTS